MYVNLIIIIDLIMVILLLITISVIYSRNSKSMFNYTYMLIPLIVYIFPISISAFNCIINLIYKAKIMFWIIGLSPILIPIAGVIYGVSISKKNEHAFNKYSKSINEVIVNYMEERNISNRESCIKLFYNKGRKVTYCKIVIKINKNISDIEIIILKTDIENLLNQKFQNFRFEVFLDRDYR